MARRGGQKSGDAHAVNQILDAASANNGVIEQDFLPEGMQIVSQADVEAVDAGSIGGTPIEQAAAALGPAALPPMDAQPPADVARRQFEELGTCYEAVERAQSHFDAKSKAAKAAKAELEDVTTTLLSVVRRMTSAPVLPLFDGVQAEADLVAMQTAASTALDGVAAGESPVDDAREAVDEMFPSEEPAAS